MDVDYIIVGCGLAGIAFSEQLLKQEKSFVVFDNASQQSSIVAGGLYNPVILKRFSTVWKSEEQLEIAIPFFNTIEKRLNIQLDYKIPVYRLFKSLQEQNNWFTRSDAPRLENYLLPKIHKNNNKHITANFGYGEVLTTGRIDTKLLIESYKTFLIKKNVLEQSTFDFSKLEINKNSLTYKKITAKKIVFAEGFGLKNNPLFNYLPLVGTKGELITIHAPDLKLDVVLKSRVFIIPLGEDLYRIGATYNQEDLTNTNTAKAKEELLHWVKTIIDCEFKCVNQTAGIRPTVIDRRPLVGVHSKNKNVFVLNGMGTRGVMIAPYAAKQLYNYIENNTTLDPEMDINRFNSK